VNSSIVRTEAVHRHSATASCFKEQKGNHTPALQVPQSMRFRSWNSNGWNEARVTDAAPSSKDR